MTNFEKITRSPEALADFLGSIMAIDCQWDHDFARAFCDDCPRENCDKDQCPHTEERNNPLWWLRQEAPETVALRKKVRALRAEATFQKTSRCNYELAAELSDAADTIEQLIGGAK